MNPTGIVAIRARLAQAAAVIVTITMLAGTAALVPTNVFVGGEGGHAVYRIPSIIRTASGRLLAFAEARGSQADNGSNNLVVRSSDDAGATWGVMRTVFDEPGRSLNNPCAVNLTSGPHAGRVLLMFQSYPTGKGEGSVAAGFDGPDTCRTLVMYSDDRGEIWSPPRDVSRQVKRPAPVTSVATGPGIGIQLVSGSHAGRVVMPFNEGPAGKWRVYAAYSDDGGDEWKLGEPAPEDSAGHGNEVQMAERPDGSLLLVARQFGGGGRRKSAVSTDGGASWSTLQAVPDLVDPSCMGGLVAVSSVGAPYLVCTGPASTKDRTNGQAWISTDGGSTWPRALPIYAGSFAYSVPVTVGDSRIGILFERDSNSKISFITLELPSNAAPAPKTP
jgi:sialidase-1